jgi:hypothetical protein
MLFFFLCYYNTGGDKKNIKSFSSYPDEVQQIVRENDLLKDSIKTTRPLLSFLSNAIVFTVVLFLFGLFIRQDSFVLNLTRLLILGQSLNLFDFLVIDLLWWRKSKRVRFTGTEEMDSVYLSPKKHFVSFLKGIGVFVIAPLLPSLVLSFF